MSQAEMNEADRNKAVRNGADMNQAAKNEADVNGSHPVWRQHQALLAAERAEVYFDGTFSTPQLNHPEGIAIDAEGHIWCGGEQGEIFRIAADGGAIQLAGSTGGFTLGIALDGKEYAYTCDLKHAAVYRLHIPTGRIELFASGDNRGNRMRVPNMPVIDRKGEFLYVTDSYAPKEAGPGIWRFDLHSGEGELWYKEPMVFANGLAISAAGDALYVVESFGRSVSRIPIGPHGEPGTKEKLVDIPALPDGIALGPDHKLYICCYEPSLIYRWSEADGLQLLYYDIDAHTLCHPTNCAFRGQDLFTSNLGRWHVTKIANATADS